MSQQINLFNPVFMVQRKFFSAYTMLQALALIIVGSSLFFAYALYQVKSLTVQLDKTSKHYIEEEDKLKRYAAELSPHELTKSMEDELKSIEVKLRVQNELIESSKGGASGNTAGYSEYMRAFARQSMSGLWLTSFKIDEDTKQLTLNGAVLSPDILSSYIIRLNNETVLRGKPVESLQMSRDGAEGRYVNFTLHSVDVDKK